MRAMSFYLADLALRASERPERPLPEPVEAGPIWTPERGAAWRAWASRDASAGPAGHAPAVTARAGVPTRLEAPSRLAVVETARVARLPKRGGWLKLILGAREPARR